MLCRDDITLIADRHSRLIGLSGHGLSMLSSARCGVLAHKPRQDAPSVGAGPLRSLTFVSPTSASSHQTYSSPRPWPKNMTLPALAVAKGFVAVNPEPVRPSGLSNARAPVTGHHGQAFESQKFQMVRGRPGAPTGSKGQIPLAM